MAKTKEISKKTVRKQVEKKLRVTFAPLETILGNKDFERRLKNARKALMKGLNTNESQLAFNGLKKSEVSRSENGPQKKDGMKSYSPQTVIPQKRKVTEADHN